MSDVLGINGLGRIGKMSLWHHIARKHFGRIAVNVGRKVGHNLTDLTDYVVNDSTYGRLHNYLGGINCERDIIILNEDSGETVIHGTEVKFLRNCRDPRSIPWRDEGVEVVVETTGAFVDPTKPEDREGGSLKGHLTAGAKLVILSAAFKIKPDSLPDDSAFLIYGINHHTFQATKHRLVSAASCTTTALAHMLLPLLNDGLTTNLVTAGMSTIHATTKSQAILDAVPKVAAKDLRRSRSFQDNIIITTTNAAKALEWVLPDVKNKGIGFLADSVRVPIGTVSLIILNCTFQAEMDSKGSSAITREAINNIYRQAEENGLPHLVEFSNKQNVSLDMKGRDAAVVIEGYETHTRTGFLNISVPSNNSEPHSVKVPVTHAKIFGWYDNELGSYSNRLGDLTVHLSDNL